MMGIHPISTNPKLAEDNKIVIGFLNFSLYLVLPY